MNLVGLMDWLDGDDPAGPTLWWLSFSDAERPKGERFLGVALVEAATLAGAITLSHLVGCNPGGGISALPIVVGDVPTEYRPALDAAPRGVLMDRAALTLTGLAAFDSGDPEDG